METTLAPGRLGGALAALRVPSYRGWFWSQVLSASGGMAQGVGLAWLVLQLTGSGVYLGLLAAASFGPVLLAGPWTGALLDRVDHRRALIATQALFFALSAALAALTAAGGLGVGAVFALAAAGGFVFALDGPARQVYVVDLVGTERTASAVGLYEVILNTSRVVGPALGGVLIATVGVSACFAVNAVSFLPPLLVLLRFRPERRAAVSPGARGPAAIREGFSYVRRRPALGCTILMALACGLLFNPGVALPVFANRSLGLGSIG